MSNVQEVRKARIENELLTQAIVENLLYYGRITEKHGLGSTLKAVAMSNPYHPLDEWVTSLHKPRVRLTSTVGHSETVSECAPKGQFKKMLDEVFVFPNAQEKAIATVYLYRWFVQVAECISGWKLDRKTQKAFIPLIVGPQGCGKTRFVQNIFGVDRQEHILTGGQLHLDAMSGKDSMHICLTYTIVELGEIETTFGASSHGALKNFASRVVDTYRLPYEKSEVTYPRCTSFIGTANSSDTLNDPTGSRRYGPFRVTEIKDPNGILDFDKLWAEFHHLWKLGEQWHLSDAEDALRGGREKEFTSSDEVSDLLNDYFADRITTTPTVDWAPVTFTKLAGYLGFRATPQMAHKVRLWFQDQGIDRRTRYRDAKHGVNIQQCWIVPLYPDHRDNMLGIESRPARGGKS